MENGTQKESQESQNLDENISFEGIAGAKEGEGSQDGEAKNEIFGQNGTQIEQDQKEFLIESLNAKVKELEDRYLRAAADYENMRRRLEKDKEQAIAYAHEQFARDILPVIDSLELAHEACKKEDGGELVKKIEEGISLTVDQVKKAFSKHGIDLVDIEEGFNPHFHEAVMHAPNPQKEDGAINQIFQKGYKIKEKLLRPAMVSIVKNG